MKLNEIMQRKRLNEPKTVRTKFETDNGIEVDATATYYGGRDAKIYGDDPHPAEEAEVEIYDIEFRGREYHPSEQEHARWVMDVSENPEEYFHSPEDEY